MLVGVADFGAGDAGVLVWVVGEGVAIVVGEVDVVVTVGGEVGLALGVSCEDPHAPASNSAPSVRDATPALKIDVRTWPTSSREAAASGLGSRLDALVTTGCS